GHGPALGRLCRPHQIDGDVSPQTDRGGAPVGTSKSPTQAALDSPDALLRTGHDRRAGRSAALHRNSCWIPLLGTYAYVLYGGIQLTGAAGPPSHQAPIVHQSDTSFPHAARVWNYWLGGKDNYPVDREIGNQILESFPPMADIARAQRTFLVRVVPPGSRGGYMPVPGAGDRVAHPQKPTSEGRGVG